MGVKWVTGEVKTNTTWAGGVCFVSWSYSASERKLLGEWKHRGCFDAAQGL